MVDLLKIHIQKKKKILSKIVVLGYNQFCN